MATEALTPARAPDVDGSGLARSLRRWFAVAAPVFAGLFAIVGIAADPAVGEEGRALWEKYAANPDALQWKSFALHWSFAFWSVAALMLAGAIRTRGIWLANVAGALAVVAATTVPGLLVIDFYDSAIGQVAGAQTTEQVNEAMESMWGVAAIVFPGLVAFVLALPLAALAAWRAGLIGLWGVAAAAAAIAVVFVSNATLWGAIAAAVLLSAFAYALARGGRAGSIVRSS